MQDKIAIFADAHGMSHKLASLIERIYAISPDIEIYSTGDLIDRGPDSKGIFGLCIKYGIKAILGNHDAWLRELIDYKTVDSFALSDIMGGKSTAESYGVSDFNNVAKAFDLLYKKIPSDHKDYIHSLPFYRIISDGQQQYVLTHAGLTIQMHQLARSKISAFSTDMELLELIQQSGAGEDWLTWSRPSFKNPNLYKFNEAIQVFGHTPVKQPIVTDNFIAMDTGCGTCEPNKLSAILLPSRTLISV